MRRFLTVTVLASIVACSSGGSTQPDRPVTAVAVSPATPSLVIGQSLQFVDTVSGGFANTPVVWTGSNSGVATLTATGLATALVPGTDTIRATAGGMSGIAVLKVSAGGVDRISVCDRSITTSCSNSAPLVALATSVVVRATAFNVAGFDISSYCVFQWAPGAAGIVSITTSTDAARHEALITRTGVGAVSVVVSCNGVNGVFTVSASATS
jgi:hypothetical protein